MKEIKVVIGKNFGDEGKGAAVYRLCQGKNAIVVRHNGGAQAGHTVEDGSFRFVFHQLGSGSPLGCPTYWSHTFLPDLLKLGDEVEELQAAIRQANASLVSGIQQSIMNSGSAMTIYAHPNCACTTIYDVILNSIAEQLRGDAKHGSCGMGIYESVLRSREETYVLHMKDVADMSVKQLVEKLCDIRDNYGEKRLKELLKDPQIMQETEQETEQEIGQDTEQDTEQEMQVERHSRNHREWNTEIQNWLEIFRDDNVLWNAAEEMYQNFHKYVRVIEWEDIVQKYDRLVMEGAQGLMLDQNNREYYPHLTPSNTGLCNVIQLIDSIVINEKDQNVEESILRKQEEIPGKTNAEKTDIEDIELEVIYVTRTYVTRHGAGRLDLECSKEDINSKMLDRTNVPNPWQDALRYAKHPVGEEFWKYIRQDMQQIHAYPNLPSPTVTLYLTHMDETNDKILFCDNNMSLAEFRQFCKEQGDAEVLVVPWRNK